MNKEKLTSQELEQGLKKIAGWSLSDDHLFREYKFKDFKRAFSAMSIGAMISEKLNHHPDWTNVYNTLTIRLSTHDAGGITRLDLKWAEQFDQALKEE